MNFTITGPLKNPPAAAPTLTLVVTTLLCALNPFTTSATNIALPQIGAEFGIKAADLGWVVNAFFLSSAVMLVLFGRLADLLGKIRIFSWGVLMFLLGSFLCAVSTAPWLFFTGRLIQGIGASMTTGTG